MIEYYLSLCHTSVLVFEPYYTATKVVIKLEKQKKFSNFIAFSNSFINLQKKKSQTPQCLTLLNFIKVLRLLDLDSETAAGCHSDIKNGVVAYLHLLYHMVGGVAIPSCTLAIAINRSTITAILIQEVESNA